ncbi:hypothetical protein A9Q81_08215 [Gammaproteobacteria bacterium 42_54_T18]|nr:hypothetical protein A9Q81_08215 [Gammaproteobacteria bacterium 42_54_T18]
MFIFVEPGQKYFKDGFLWVVKSIEGNLVKSRCVEHDVNDVETLKEFNRQVVRGAISVAGVECGDSRPIAQEVWK